MKTDSNGTSPPHPQEFHVYELNILFGILSLVSGVMGLFGNLIILRIFLRNSKSLSGRIFLTIAINDMTSSLFGAIPFSIPRLFANNPGLYKYTALCNLTGLMLNISERYSVFLIAMLSVTRAWALKYPLFRIPKGRVVACLGVYFILQLLLACVPYYKAKLYTYQSVYTLCTWALDDIVIRKENPALFQVLYYSFLVVPFLLPSIVVVISCGCCIASIRESRMAFKDRNKTRATITIIIFTITYIVLHVPLWIFMMIFLVDNHGVISPLFYTTTPIYMFMFSSKVSVFINAALNPLIYMMRCAIGKQSFRVEVSRAASKVTILKRTMRTTYGKSPLVRSFSEKQSRRLPDRLAYEERGLSLNALDKCTKSCETFAAAAANTTTLSPRPKQSSNPESSRALSSQSTSSTPREIRVTDVTESKKKRRSE